MICRACQRALRTLPRAALPLSTPSRTIASFSLASRPSAPRALPTTPLASLRLYSTPSAPQPLEKPDFLDDAEAWIWDTLAAEFSPSEMSVRDVSGGCGSMYAIDITSEAFRGAGMLKQQRMVNKVLGDKVKEWHGLQLRTKAP
ncbi:bola protein [Plectosphaerella cucumerina]|jgi:stress-induced morphogen|uniref:Bola protein n=1 Tax=Plectosphaerella cucumerina TaxID=40658 RepID=A0A8K0X935_9PEZI|nr:bola protein [Plectosphaerella cucumerina]